MAAPPLPVPYTLREALHGNAFLEPCVASIQHAPSAPTRARLLLFTPLLDRPKQALHHLLELFILHVCYHPPPNPAPLLAYLSAAAQHLVPPVRPARSAQYLLPGPSGAARVTQLEEAYPRHVRVDADRILDIIASYSAACDVPDLTLPDLQGTPGLMDEPAKTAVMVYAAFLAARDVRNGWLRPYLQPPLGRRERARAGGRRGRAEEELHTVFATPFVDSMGHLVWYTVRHARRGEIIARPATSYARGNLVRINSSKSMTKSVRVHHSQICNANVLDYRMWESWTDGARAVGPCAGLGNHALSARVVRFDKPVRIEAAFAVGFRVVDGVLVNPKGRELTVARRPDGVYAVKTSRLRCPRKEKEEREKGVAVVWRPGMKCA